MKVPGIEISLDQEKVCKLMPSAVAVVCGFIFLATNLFEITWVYSLLYMLVFGISATVYLSTLMSNKKDDVVPLEYSDEPVFDELDQTESMLLNLESITLLVNDLSARQIETSRIQTEDAVTAILKRFSRFNDELALFTKVNQLEQNAEVQKLLASLADILVSFQFQDRTSQILHHVSNSLEMFNNEIKSIQELRRKDGQPEYDKDEIIKKITAGFRTSEQRAMMSETSNKISENSVEIF